MRFLLRDLKHRASSLSFVPTPITLVAWAVLQATSLSAQPLSAEPTPPVVVDETPMQLQSSKQLQEQIPADQRSALPTFVYGERIFGRPNLETVVEGNAMLRRGDMVIKANRLEYDQSTDQAKASGQVRINKAGNVFEGPLLELKLDTFEGFFNEPRFYFVKNDMNGEAARIDFIDEQRTLISHASLTTCRRLPGPDWLPDWILRATSIGMDNEEDVGTAQGAVLSFKGVPLLPIPYLTFPLSDRRKSGLLPPSLGLDNINGVEVAVPYYWNIAPNRDATITPTLMTKRGVNLGSQFRYLEADYSGQLRLDLMPGDKLRDSNRWSLAYQHQTRLDNALTRGLTDNGAALSLNLNQVSDDDYWRDFTRSGTSLTQRLLPTDAALSWSNGHFSNTLRTLKWQTLQDVTAPIVPPYDRLPQLATRYSRSHASGFDYSVDADYTQFHSDRTLTGQPNAQRAFSLLSLSRPWMTSAGFITPKVQLHATSYQFDAPLANGRSTASRVLPTFSLDTGLVFERDTQYFGRALLQTLEPRAFYVNTPFRDQRLLPNYDSGAYDFNFATIWTENAFVGNDRIADNNLLTLGLTTRLLDPDSGAEVARLGVAQRLRLSEQNVTLLPTDAKAPDGISDILLGASIKWDPKWVFESTVQYNPTTEQSVRSTVGARYNPGNYRTVSAAYRFQRTASEQLDIGWQWPLNDLWGDTGQNLGPGRGQGEGRWYSVGRLNYSLDERRLVDALVGFEYDAGCWLGRVVLEQSQVSHSSATQRIMFQLEFVGFTRLGVSPLKTLKNSIPSYQYLREATDAPSRFSNYD